MARGRQVATIPRFGVVPDPASESLPPEVWSQLHNIVFRDHTQRVKGLAYTFGTPLFPPIWMQFGFDATGSVPVWMYAGTDGVGIFDGATHTDITPVDWLVPTELNNPFTGGSLNNVMVLNNGRRAWYWPGAGVMERLPGWSDTLQASAVRPYKFHLIAMGIVDAGVLLVDQIRWSSAANPGQVPASWTPAAANEAGSTTLSQSPGACLDGLPLRGQFMVYKSTSAYTIQYVGGSEVMFTRLLFGEVGVLSRNCIGGLSEFHLVLTDGDVILHDGQIARSLAEGRNRRTMFRQVNGDQVRRSFVAVDENAGEVWVCVPEAGAQYPSIAWIWNKRHDSWSSRSLPELSSHVAAGQVRLAAVAQSWDSDPAAWDTDPTPWDEGAPRIDFYQLAECSPVSVGGVGAFYAVDGGFLNLGAPIDARVTREGIDLGDSERVKTAKALWIESRGTPGSVLLVRCGATMVASGPVAYGPEIPYVIGVDRKVDCYATGRFLAFTIRSESALEVEPWEIVSAGFEFDARGDY